MRLIHGECLEEMSKIESGSVDAVICDPPYGTTNCKWDSVINLESMWAQLNRIIKPNGSIVLFSQQPFTSKLISSNYKDYKHSFYWHKDKCANFILAKHQPLRIIEDINVFSTAGFTGNAKIKAVFNSQMIDRRPRGKTPPTGKSDNLKSINPRPNNAKLKSGKDFISGKGYAKNLIYFTTDHKEKYHPTQKPVLLMEYLIKTYTNENETVLDFTMGSGTTGRACKNLKRHFIGIEKDDKYFAIAKERIEKDPEQLTF